MHDLPHPLGPAITIMSFSSVSSILSIARKFSTVSLVIFMFGSLLVDLNVRRSYVLRLGFAVGSLGGCITLDVRMALNFSCDELLSTGNHAIYSVRTMSSSSSASTGWLAYSSGWSTWCGSGRPYARPTPGPGCAYQVMGRVPMLRDRDHRCIVRSFHGFATIPLADFAAALRLREGNCSGTPARAVRGPASVG